MAKADAVRQFVLEHVEAHAEDLAKLLGAHFGITRQAANAHLRRLAREGLIEPEGRTHARRYRLKPLAAAQVTLPVADLAEDVVWTRHVAPHLEGIAENIADVCSYGVTEMVNNAIDHSGGTHVSVAVERTAASITLSVHDDGIGVFRKIREAVGLDDERHAILELVKGKFTTDPQHHTGEGIFFTSRMFDGFVLRSGRLALVHRRAGPDWLIQDAPQTPAGDAKGTLVRMTIDAQSMHTDREVFERYAGEQDDYAFRRTHVVVALAQAEGEKLVSRSQAKRVMARLDRFREVLLDFKGVETIGPAFADEIYRVYRSDHPDVSLETTGANERVTAMIRRALTSAGL